MTGILASISLCTQVAEEVFDTCNLSVPPLYEWGEPSVDNSASISSLTPGTYYFICAVSGHCDAGMKIQVGCEAGLVNE